MEKIKILIIDDEERLLRILRMGLGPLGYQIRTASNGEEGLEELLSQSFDVVLTDIKMPIMLGTEFVYELERLSMDVPVIVMTAFPDVSTATKSLKHGAVDYIQKPFTIDEVDRIIRQVLKQRQATTHEQILTLKDGMQNHEKEIIEKALIKTRNNKAQTAKLLDISERTLWYKIKKYKIDM